uniref:Uncharacterized protein n=1 Tax=Oryza nivara TaxID=4536 RepID=A0A0E0HWG3_ORYNI
MSGRRALSCYLAGIHRLNIANAARGAMTPPSPESPCRTSRRPSLAVLSSSSCRGAAGARVILAWPVATSTSQRLLMRAVVILLTRTVVESGRAILHLVEVYWVNPEKAISVPSCRGMLRIIKTARNVIKLPSSSSL